MATCPVCEHVQDRGDECEVCGRRLTGPGATPLPVAPLEGLEPTLAEAVTAPAERLDGLEPTLHAPGEDAPPEDAAAWIEGTRTGAVGAVALEPVPDLEPTLAAPVRDGLPAPDAPPTCRYCRTPAARGDRFCGRCGMRLPRLDAVKLAAEIRGELVCPDCGSFGAGPRCRRCGAPMRQPA